MTKLPQPQLRRAAIHAGEDQAERAVGLSPDIVMASSFEVAPGIGFSATEMDAETPYFYTRWANPTVRQLERKVAALDAGVRPVLTFLQSIAGIAWVPLAIIWFGIGQGAVVFVIANTIFFGTIYSTIVGIRSVPMALRRSAAIAVMNTISVR